MTVVHPEVPRWFLLAVLAGCLVGLLVWARGPVHHHGRYVGSLGADQVAVVLRAGA